LNASILQPTAILGPNDFKQGLLSKEMSAIANGERKFNICISYNFIDVRDLCETTINCIKKGRKGQNYIIGGHYFDTH
jgi:dihydroflavonol-4-reductase